MTDLLRPLWRALVVFRVLGWGFAVLGVITRWDTIERRWGAVVLLAVMAVWTIVVSCGYSRGWGRRNTRLAVADLLVTLACMAGTLLAQPFDAVNDGAAILTSVWAAGPVLALGLARGRDGGLIAAVVVSLGTAAFTWGDWERLLNNVQLLVVAGLVVGYAATATRRADARLTDAIATEAATAERLRISRSIHDGVLQVLAQVQRRGDDLAELAAEQEVRLRGLITADTSRTTGSGQSDLRAGLSVLAGPRVEIVVPADPVPLSAHTAAELVGAVREALANAERHAGPSARAWVAVEDLGGSVSVVVRDDGAGTTPSRLDEAARDGRLGVAQSIRGRIADLGGTAQVRTAPGEGVEWELQVNR